MPTNIDDVEFTIFDTETTGLEPESGDRIVEIAALRFKGEQMIRSFETLVNPRRQISEPAFQVNRITTGMLKNAPAIEDIMPDFLEFIRSSCLCSYNAGFDLGFLNNELKLIGRERLSGIITVDILKMARRMLPAMERYALWFVAGHLGINISQKHRALSDVELTWEVFKRLKGILNTKGIVDYRNFVGLFGIKNAVLEDMNNQKVAEIQEAIDLGVKLKIKYLASSSAQVTERQVIPKEIRQEKGYNYLVGYCCLRQDERSFRLDGILHLEIV